MKYQFFIIIFLIIALSATSLAEVHPHKFCSILPVESTFTDINSSVRIKLDPNNIEEYELNLVGVEKDKTGYIYHFCRDINLSRGSYENWIGYTIDNQSEIEQQDTIFKKPLDCDRRMTFEVIGCKVFKTHMERFRNIGYIDINMTYDCKDPVEFYDLLGNKKDTCNVTLKGYGKEDGTIFSIKKPIAEVKDKLKIRVNYGELRSYSDCVFDFPSRIEVKIPEQKFLRSLKLNIIDPIPDLTYKDGKNLVIIWKRDESRTSGQEFFNITFSYKVDWNVLWLGFFGMIMAILLGKGFEIYIFPKLTKKIKCHLCSNKYKNKRELNRHILIKHLR